MVAATNGFGWRQAHHRHGLDEHVATRIGIRELTSRLAGCCRLDWSVSASAKTSSVPTSRPGGKVIVTRQRPE